MPGRTFPVEVEGIGTFVFRERTMLDHIQIEQECRRQSAGLQDQDLILAVEATITLPRLIVSAPAAFDPTDLDPLDRDTWVSLGKVYGGLRSAEEEFRAQRAAKRAGVGSRHGNHAGVPVSPPVQPATD